MKRLILLFILVFTLPLQAQLRTDGALREKIIKPELEVSGDIRTSTLTATSLITGDSLVSNGGGYFGDDVTIKNADNAVIVRIESDEQDAYLILDSDNSAVGDFASVIYQGEGASEFKLNYQPNVNIFTIYDDVNNHNVMAYDTDDGLIVFTGNINPEADGTRDLGTQTTAQWANVWADLVNGADYAFLNDFRILEAEKYRGYPSGIAIGNTYFKDGVVTEKMPDDAKPLFVVTEKFIEYKGRRITVEMLDKLIYIFQ